MDAKKIEYEINARMEYLKDIYVAFDKTIPLNIQIEKNIYNLDEMLLDEGKKNQIPWNSLFFIYIYVIWSPEDKILTRGVIKKVFNSLIEYEIFILNIEKEDTYRFTKMIAIKKFEGWENSINDIYHKENHDILIHWITDKLYIIGQKEEN